MASGPPTDDIATTHFQHTPLEDPKEQIRLLLFLPTQGDDIRLTLSTFTPSKAPQYHAISYTWGEDTSQWLIEINQCPFVVGKNCYKAMTKVRLHHPHSHFWIDSVCINQSDNTEKSAQVARMFDIFRNAAHVLACLGDLHMVRDLTGIRYHAWNQNQDHVTDEPSCFADDVDAPELDSDTLAHNLAQATQALEYRIREEVPQGDIALGNLECLDSIREAWLSSVTPSTALALRHGIWSFFAQEYWSRLWVMPEIVAAGDDLELLVGSAKMSSYELYLLAMLTGGHDTSGKFASSACDLSRIWVEKRPPFYLSYDIELHCIGTVAFLPRQDVPLRTALSYSWQKLCSDPRDRIYCFLPLMGSHVPFRPDYSKSCLQLAVELFQYIREDEENHKSKLYAIAPALEVAEEDLARALGIEGSLKAEIERIAKKFGARRRSHGIEGSLYDESKRLAEEL